MADRSIAPFGPLAVGERPLPHYLDAERAVLGAVLQEPALIHKAMSRLARVELPFFSPAHQAVYEHMAKLSKDRQLIDPISLNASLQQQNRLDELGGETFVLSLMGALSTTANFDKYLDLVVEAAVRRRLISQAHKTIGSSFDGNVEPATVITDLQKNLLEMSLGAVAERERPIGDSVNEVANQIAASIDQNGDLNALRTDFADLDDKIGGGLKNGEMIVLAARPSIGKTTLALNIAANICLRSGHEEPVPVGVFSLEMSRTELTKRVLCAEASIDLRSLQRSGQGIPTDKMHAFINACEVMRHAPIIIDDSAVLDIVELRAKAFRMKERFGIRAIVVDYLQLVKSSGLNRNASREQEVAQISSTMKAIAKELNLPVLILCQMNRQAEEGKDSKPRLNQLRESGAIEQDADVVLIMNRSRETQYEAKDEDRLEGLETEIIIAKNRNGETGTITLKFFAQYTRFDSNTPGNRHYNHA